MRALSRGRLRAHCLNGGQYRHLRHFDAGVRAREAHSGCGVAGEPSDVHLVIRAGAVRARRTAATAADLPAECHPGCGPRYSPDQSESARVSSFRCFIIAVKPVWFRLPGNRRGTRILSTHLRCHQMIMHGDLGAGRLIDALNGSIQHCVERGIRLVGRQPLDQRP